MQGELLFEVKCKLLPMVFIGKVPEGTRVNIPFVGEMSGPVASGKFEGTDYILLRNDGVGVRHSHAVITTSEGELIAVQGSGISTTAPDGRNVLKGVQTYQTGSKKLAWLNSTQGLDEGFAEMAANKLELKIFKL